MAAGYKRKKNVKCCSFVIATRRGKGKFEGCKSVRDGRARAQLGQRSIEDIARAIERKFVALYSSHLFDVLKNKWRCNSRLCLIGKVSYRFGQGLNLFELDFPSH
jgi:hypothetical protein